MKAIRLFYDKAVLPDGGIVEMVIWRVPAPVPPTTHGLKYRLFYGHKGERIVGYDNERGKGDHRHVEGLAAHYELTSVERLIADFLADMAKQRSKR